MITISTTVSEALPLVVPDEFAVVTGEAVQAQKPGADFLAEYTCVVEQTGTDSAVSGVRDDKFYVQVWRANGRGPGRRSADHECADDLVVGRGDPEPAVSPGLGLLQAAGIGRLASGSPLVDAPLRDQPFGCAIKDRKNCGNVT